LNRAGEDMVRIVDVAKRAGVSPATVSHVLSGKRPIGAAARKRVLDAVAELNYIPNPNAKALREKESGIIGFYGSDISEAFVSRTIRGVEQLTRFDGKHLVFASGVDFHNDVGKAVEFLARRRLDGIILSFAFSDPEPVEISARLDCPVVVVNRAVCEPFHSIQPDNRRGGWDAARHLIEAGSRVPAFIGGPVNRPASRDRENGFRAALAEHGVPFGVDRLYAGDYSHVTGVLGLKSLLARCPEIDGIFCANDYIAAGAINTASSLGRSVPDDLKIIGFDNRDFSEFWPTPISTFDIPLEEAGQLAVRLLQSEMKKEKVPERVHLVETTLIKRRSSGG
jgi:DNA-binding LacI/PurR family transcriptional regulator